MQLQLMNSFLGKTAGVIFAMVAVGVAVWLWETVEAIRWVAVGVFGLFLLIILAELWPLWVALAALVYLGKNC